MLNLKRVIKSFKYAFRGLEKAFLEEQNLKIQSLVAIIALLSGWYFEISGTEWLFLIISITLVLLMELINSAVERITDILKPRLDSLVKEIKDIAAAAVMLSSISALIIGSIIFIPYIF